MQGQFAATTSTFYNIKRGGERLRSWGSANAETRVIVVSQKAFRILLLSFCVLLRFQIQGGLSPLSVTDRGESLLGFETVAKHNAQRASLMCATHGPAATVSAPRPLQLMKKS